MKRFVGVAKLLATIFLFLLQTRIHVNILHCRRRTLVARCRKVLFRQALDESYNNFKVLRNRDLSLGLKFCSIVLDIQRANIGSKPISHIHWCSFCHRPRFKADPHFVTESCRDVRHDSSISTCCHACQLRMRAPPDRKPARRERVCNFLP